MLLHMLLVVLFGSTISGGARRGDGWLGPLDVTLRQMSPEQGSGFRLAPGADTNLPGAALLRRLEGSTTAPAARPQVQAAPSVVRPEPASASLAPAPATTEISESVPDVSLSPPPPPVEPLPRLDRNAPVEVDKPIISPAVSPPSVSTPLVLPPTAEREIAPPVALPPRETTMPPMPPLERIPPARIERQLAPTIELAPREQPKATLAEPIAPAKADREQAPPVEVKPRDVPLPPMAPIERIDPPKFERQFAPPVELPAPRKAPVENNAPARAAPTAERDSAEIAPVRERAPPAAAAPGRAPAAQAPARTAAPTGAELPRLRLGAPDVDEEVFRSRRDVVEPATETGGASGITAETLRRQAREIAREGSGSRGVLNLVPPPPPQERKDALAEGIAKAAKPDCRTAYAGLGLLAVVPLVASSVGNGGCRW